MIDGQITQMSGGDVVLVQVRPREEAGAAFWNMYATPGWDSCGISRQLVTVGEEHLGAIAAGGPEHPSAANALAFRDAGRFTGIDLHRASISGYRAFALRTDGALRLSIVLAHIHSLRDERIFARAIFGAGPEDARPIRRHEIAKIRKCFFPYGRSAKRRAGSLFGLPVGQDIYHVYLAADRIVKIFPRRLRLR